MRAGTGAYRRGGGVSSAFVRHGLPLVALLVAGSAGLASMLRGRQDVRQEKEEREWAQLQAERSLRRDSRIHIGGRRGAEGEGPRGRTGGVIRSGSAQLEEELEAMKQHLDIDTYENKPVPRPSRAS